MDRPCEENLRLAQVVAQAIESVYSLRQQHRAAIKNNVADANHLLVLLEKARKAQHETERNLREHVAAHNCGRYLRRYPEGP
jgi:hypothetical protein